LEQVFGMSSRSLRKEFKELKSPLPLVKVEATDEEELMSISSMKFAEKAPTILGGPFLGRMRGFLGSKAFKVNLNYRGGFLTTANTAYTTVIGVNPALSSEISYFATLFDEMRVDGFTLDFTHLVVPGNAAAPNWSSLGGLAFDPTGSGALSGVANAWIHTQHCRLNLLKGIGLDQGISVNSNMYDAKFQRWRVTIPKGPHTSSSGTYAGEWVSTSDSTDNFGWIKPYFEAGGANTQFSFQYVLTFHMSMRSRS
jgi:hypothetical protein